MSVYIPKVLKIGDKIRYKKFHNITGTITKLDSSGLWVVNDALLATEDEIELDNDLPYWTPSIKKCTCGSSSLGSDRHSDYCDRYIK